MMPEKITTSEIRSAVESMNAPDLLSLEVALATAPSIISRPPAASKRIPANGGPPGRNLAYARAERTLRTRPSPVQKLGGSPVEAATLPAFSIKGLIDFLSFSRIESHRSCSQDQYILREV